MSFSGAAVDFSIAIEIFALASGESIQRHHALRTAALGGHRDRAIAASIGPSHNSCRNGHCPKCQTMHEINGFALDNRKLLPVTYYHVVFSVPHRLVPLISHNKRVLFALLFEATGATLLEVAATPKRLGALMCGQAETGLTSP